MLLHIPTMKTKLQLKALLILFQYVLVSSLSHKFLTSNSTSPSYRPNENPSHDPLSTLLVPEQDKPMLGNSLVDSPPSSSIRLRNSHKKKKRKIRKLGVYIAVGILTLTAIVITAGSAFIYWKKKKKNVHQDLEMQHPGLSVRTTSDKNVSFEGSHYTNDDQTVDMTTTPHKTLVENYTYDEILNTTERFNLNNLIEGNVFHARLKGKDTVIKRVTHDVMSKIDIGLLYDAIHHHPNIIRTVGTCVIEGSDSFIVLEYAKNGSLKDWLHGGLAMKSHFIASCDCFLSWNQRLKICLDVATALQYMHHIMSPSYVHRSIRTRNIFLDEEFNAKVGNFGMAGCVTDDKEESQNLAPEYIRSDVIAPSMDIFAYGVVLLEVITGKTFTRNDDEKGEKGDGYIKMSNKIKVVLKSDDIEELREWIDSALGENYSLESTVTLADLAISCVDDDPCLRPNAGEIVEKLLRLVEELQERDQSSVCESSCKPLVKAAANNT